MIKMDKDKVNNHVDSLIEEIYKLQDKLSQKEFELKAADHVLAEKEKEIEILTNKLNNL